MEKRIDIDSLVMTLFQNPDLELSVRCSSLQRYRSDLYSVGGFVLYPLETRSWFMLLMATLQQVLKEICI